MSPTSRLARSVVIEYWSRCHSVVVVIVVLRDFPTKTQRKKEELETED
jgi:hypothetical protein